MEPDPIQQQLQAMTRALQAHGIPLTRQRGIVLKLLAGNTSHPTAQSIVVALQEQQVSRATVYNTLHLLTQEGLLKVVRGFDSNLHFDPNCERHHHRICPECGQLQDIPWEEIAITHLGHPISAPVIFEAQCAECAPS